MEDVAKYVQRILVMDEGEVFCDGAPGEVFQYYKQLEQIGLGAPEVTYLMHDLGERGMAVDVNVTTVEEAKQSILKLFLK